MRRNVNELQDKQLKKALQELKGAGLINYEFDNKDGVKIEINLRAKLDMYNSIGNIPIPVSLYEKLKNDTGKSKDFCKYLSMLLGIYYSIYLKNGEQLDLLPDIPLEIEPDPILLDLILEGYNLHMPIINFQNPNFYWFAVKKEFISKLEELAKKQDMKKFAK